MNNDAVIAWLLEEGNPAIKYRTLTEILDEPADKEPVIAWLYKFLPADFAQCEGLWSGYYLTACAESGLSCEDIPEIKEMARAYAEGGAFGHGCSDYMSLRAFVRLGFGGEPEISRIITQLSEKQLPDGGFLCEMRLGKFKYVPKSCYKANLYALMLCAECKKRNIKIDIEESILSYFWKRNLFYRTDDPGCLVLNGREGWRNVDTFYPFEVMRVGLQNIVEAFCALGFGNDPRLNEAWDILHSKKDSEGKYRLDGTLSKSYLPKERVGKPSMWVTFYALLAEGQLLH